MTGTPDGEVMMNITKPDALQHIEITVLRQLGDNIAAQTRHLETLTGKVDDVRERVIRIEARETEKHVEALNARVAALEARDNQITGVTSLGGWIAQHAPWLVAGILAAMAILGKK